MKITNRIIFFLITSIVFATILYKVFTLPITHDEVSTAVHYYNFSVWEIMMFPDNWPNNHILNTLLSKLFINIFGNETWSVRFASMLSFIVYAYAIYRLINLLFKKESIFVIAALSLFLTNPYLLEFFGLSRGYSMASAFVTLSVSYFITAFKNSNEKHIWVGVILSILASYANFTVLVYWVASGLITAMYFIISYKDNISKLMKKITILAVISIFYSALIAVPIIKMTSTDQFKYWTSNGFYNDTLISLVDNWKYSDKFLSNIDSNVFGGFVIVLFLIALIVIVKELINNKNVQNIIKQPLTIAALALSFTILVSLMQTLVLGTPNINGRIGLFLYPLFSIILLVLLSEIDNYSFNKWINYSFAVIIPLFLFFHLFSSYNPRSVREWWYEENNFEVMDFLRKDKPKGKIKLQTHWYFYNSFNYYNLTGKTPRIELLPNNIHEVNKNSKAEYYYVLDSEVNKLEPNFKKIKEYKWGRVLMKRNKEL